MPFDGCVVPEALRPYIDWVTGMAWPEGDPQGCFRMADACVVAAHQVVADTEAADPATARMVGELWDGAAQQEFVIHVQRTVGGRRADLVQRLIRAAISLNGVGVAIQHAQRMITLIVLFLLIALPLVIWQAPWALRPLLQIARMSAVQIRNTTVMYMIAFGAFGAALTFLTRYTQREGGRLDEIDGHELLISARDGAINGMLTGLLGGGLGRLATPALRAGVARAEATLGETLLARLTTTLPGQSLQYGIAGSATTAISMALDGRPLDWDLIVKGGTSAVLGVDGQHLLGPHLSPRHAEGGGASPPGRSSDGMPDAGPPLGHQAAGAPAPGVHRAEDGARPDGTPPTGLAQAAPDGLAHTPRGEQPSTPGPSARGPQIEPISPVVAARPDPPMVTPARDQPAGGPRTRTVAGEIPEAPVRPPAAAPHRAIHETAPAHAVPQEGGGRTPATTADRTAGVDGSKDRAPGVDPVEERLAGDNAGRAGDANGSGHARPTVDDLINRSIDPPAHRETARADEPEGLEVWDGGWEQPGTRLADSEQVLPPAPQAQTRASGDGWTREAPLHTVEGPRHLDDARNALAEGDVAGARAAADAARAAAERARQSPEMLEHARARAEHNARQAERIADLTEWIQRDGSVPRDTLIAFRDLGVNLEISLFGEHERRDTSVFYDEGTNTLHVHQGMKWRSVNEDFVRYLKHEFHEALADRSFRSQEVTDWDGLSQWSEGAARFRTDGEWGDWVAQHMTPQSRELTGAQRDSLYTYRETAGYGPINQPLRGQGELSPEAAAHVTNLDAAMLHSVVPADVVVTRQVGADAFDRPLDRLEGTTQRDLAYLSTSTGKNPLRLIHFATTENLVKVWLRLPAGTHAVHLQGVHPHVDALLGPTTELLLDRGTRYRVDKVLFEDGQYKVFGTVLEQEG
ncbi:hypothetical protein GCM10010412_040610 [Nonomuraea recticatena]|uniref:ADP ribosyltransferase domain-containing protein n=2 Tax=Nonomuraea recticatena TaxID=46178 RepID=A0ABN3S333_9ACTN